MVKLGNDGVGSNSKDRFTTEEYIYASARYDLAPSI